MVKAGNPGVRFAFDNVLYISYNRIAKAGHDERVEGSKAKYVLRGKCY